MFLLQFDRIPGNFWFLDPKVPKVVISSLFRNDNEPIRIIISSFDIVSLSICFPTVYDWSLNYGINFWSFLGVL